MGLILPSRGGLRLVALVLRGLSAWWVLRDSDPVLSVWAVEAGKRTSHGKLRSQFLAAAARTGTK